MPEDHYINFKDFSVEERFGETIADGKWGIVPFALYKYQKNLGLTNSEVWFLCWVIMHKWGEEDSFPSLSALARYSGRTRTYMQKITRDLVEKGYIVKRERRLDNGATASNYYDISPLIERLEKEIEALPVLEGDE